MTKKRIIIFPIMIKEGVIMENNIRPETMKRITTPELANAFIEEQVALVREQVGDKKVLLALSGGVDSSVVAALLIKAIGKQLVCVHVNHGLMRKGESEQVIEVFRKQVGDKKVLLALSGGVDSYVLAALLLKAIGQQLYCVHVNHGLMRKNESENVI